MNTLTFKGLTLGNHKGYIWVACDESNKKVFENKSYFNKCTDQILVYKCKLGNEGCEIIDYDKEVLLIRVLYIRTDFDNERIYRVKNYIYLDNTLYQNNNDIKRVPREVRLLLEDYFQDVNISIKVNLPEN